MKPWHKNQAGIRMPGVRGLVTWQRGKVFTLTGILCHIGRSRANIINAGNYAF